MCLAHTAHSISGMYIAPKDAAWIRWMAVMRKKRGKGSPRNTERPHTMLNTGLAHFLGDDGTKIDEKQRDILRKVQHNGKEPTK